ncbi:His Kinase A (phospho-acceptor) domain-containing protein [Ectothiorhodosinus mongolicus]|uniref:histidine kinase n=1 Tax=Ectothiorhodosinus mongolicus TaxID=233100 RepID=A0A1R3VMT3_9GAMM|nr:ATP-binding protein [Ectothiorhodosinus mongolicus]ULX56374.1 hypothetical protein CKX93_00800 [Ectothiorhodosinus mongolicus]SIT65891.1 His Kinase A (phospho-acceptor) domain-containing protein [Ectothiorhodosinus mongolicus]
MPKDGFEISLLAKLAHELRTPLTASLGYAQLLAKRPSLDAESGEMAAAIEQASRAGLALVNDMLDWSRLEMQVLAPRKRAFELRSVITQAADWAWQRPGIAHVHLDIDIAAEVPEWLVGDPDRLRQILINVLHNAARFTQSGEVRLRAEYSSESGGWLDLAVEDDGPGVPEAFAERIFEPFFQTPEAAAKSEGSGLGLAIVKGLAELMGGSIKLVSPPDRGSVFSLGLPLPVAIEVESPPRSTHPQRVLLVDDSKLHRYYGLQVLAPLEAEIVQASCGEEALSLIREQRFDLVLLDLQLPDMSGLMLRSELRQRACLAPVIAVTGAPELCAAEDMAEFAAVLSKPLDPSVLQAELRALFPSWDSSALTAQPASPDTDLEQLWLAELAETIAALENPDYPREALAALLHRLRGSAGVLKKGTDLF